MYKGNSDSKKEAKGGIDRELTPAMKQYIKLKAKYPDSLLLFRLGDFYELFFEDAKIASRVLEIALTTRERGKEDPIPMCGVPYHSVDAYIEKLLNAGYKVAIAEQLEDPKKAKGIVKRDVVRVITPSTAIEMEGERGESSYLGALWKDRERIAAVFLDLSTGEVLGDELDEIELKKFVSLLEPRELISNEEVKGIRVQKIKTEIEGETNLDKAFSLAKRYVSSLRGKIPVLKPLRRLKKGFFIDDTTARNLELFRNIRDGTKKGSLIQVIDYTLTPMGARKLRDTLKFPLSTVEEINERLEAVEELVHRGIEREEIRQMLEEIGDMERIATRAVFDVAGPRDLAFLRENLKKIPGLKERISSFESRVLRRIGEKLDPLGELLSLLENGISENPPYLISQGGVIKKGFNPELDELKEISKNAKSVIMSLENQERERTGIKKLRIGYNKVFGYYIEIPRSYTGALPPEYQRKQTLVNSERFITPKIKELEEKIMHAEERIKELEEWLFREIRKEVANSSERIKANAELIAELDLVSSFAELAARRRYTRPVVHKGKKLQIKAGRHPVVEVLKKGEVFVPNDTFMDESKRVLIITGPNMGGKSTYLRQVALISLLAHCGSFVPADSAEIPIMDRIFTRIGASDFLAGGESTFMVEMREAAEILSRATDRSLVILDEIGRGTSTYDGISIAWAVVEYLHDRIKAKTLFATHYYELTELAEKLPAVFNYHIKVAEWQGEVVFLYELEEGASEKSYGIHVAALAGLPRNVISRAWEVLSELEGKRAGRKSKTYQPSLFEEEDPVKKWLKEINPDKLTPLEALELIYKLKKKIGK
ncbi:MAG: DNA mismatch repair protein MutS [Candidatus Aminicenantes bacterium]|nr:DNA mismatch repair protein MutS [Candidatus Aminicenantes bacterium]